MRRRPTKPPSGGIGPCPLYYPPSASLAGLGHHRLRTSHSISIPESSLPPLPPSLPCAYPFTGPCAYPSVSALLSITEPRVEIPLTVRAPKCQPQGVQSPLPVGFEGFST